MKPKSIENWVRSVAMVRAFFDSLLPRYADAVDSPSRATQRDNTINGFPTLLNSTVKQFKLFVAIKEYLEE